VTVTSHCGSSPEGISAAPTIPVRLTWVLAATVVNHGTSGPRGLRRGLTGRWSDRVGRRKIFVVVVAGSVMAVAAGILEFWQKRLGMLTAAVVPGVGFGAVFAIDLAIGPRCCPSRPTSRRTSG